MCSRPLPQVDQVHTCPEPTKSRVHTTNLPAWPSPDTTYFLNLSQPNLLTCSTSQPLSTQHYKINIMFSLSFSLSESVGHCAGDSTTIQLQAWVDNTLICAFKGSCVPRQGKGKNRKHVYLTEALTGQKWFPRFLRNLMRLSFIDCLLTYLPFMLP